MRIFHPATLLLVLGSCDAPPSTGTDVAGAGNVIATAPSASEEPAQPAPPTAPESSPTPGVTKPEAPALPAQIPAAFHGRFDESAAACAGASEYRLVISPTELRFHESAAKVRSVSVDEPLAVTVTAEWEGEGERWTGTRQLQLSKDLNTIMITGQGTGVTRVRCE